MELRQNSPDFVHDFNVRWTKTLEYCRRRSPILFLSTQVSFWGRHGFVQQSLAKELTENGIDVIWIDGADWKKINHEINNSSPLLKVAQLRRLPGRRFSFISNLSNYWENAQLKKIFQKGKNPLCWVYGGLPEAIAEQLPYVDILSIFDNPYSQEPQDQLCKKASTLHVQNSFTKNLYSPSGDKCLFLYPPTDISTLPQSEKCFRIPDPLPQKAMGYIGTFKPDGFDFILFEEFIHRLQDWTFILCGRSDASAGPLIKKLRQYPNFLYLPWRPRNELAEIWRALSVSLLFYRPSLNSAGAFPVKILDSLFYGVPSIATQVPKTQDLEGFIPRSSYIHELIQDAMDVIETPKSKLSSLYNHFRFQMDPKTHLIDAVEHLQRTTGPL